MIRVWILRAAFASYLIMCAWWHDGLGVAGSLLGLACVEAIKGDLVHEQVLDALWGPDDEYATDDELVRSC